MSDEVKEYESEPDVHYFVYNDKAKNEKVYYKLIVISGAERDTYIKAIKKRTKRNPTTGTLEVDEVEGLTAQILLLATRRNFGSPESPDWRKIELAETQSWPSPMQQELNKKALAMSGLDNKSAEEAKND